MGKTNDDRRLLLRLSEMLTEEHPRLRATPADRDRMRKFRDQCLPWIHTRGVQGIGIARKVTDGAARPEVALKVYVERKKPLARLDDAVPKRIRIPGHDRRLFTDVEELGRLRLETNRSEVRPLVPGFSIGAGDAAGTLGCLVRRSGSPELLLLSNSHVLSRPGFANSGPILQPARQDGGTVADNHVAELLERVELKFSKNGHPNRVDAAIARLVGEIGASGAIRLLGIPTGSSPHVRQGTRVQKTGATSDFTVGVVKDPHFKMRASYDTPAGRRRAGFQQQVLCTKYSRGGDSGAVVLNTSGKVVGLHFAGSASGSVFHRIGHVLSALRVELVVDGG